MSDAGTGARIAIPPAVARRPAVDWRTGGWVLLPTLGPLAFGVLAASWRPVLLGAIGIAVALAVLSFVRLRTRPVLLFASVLVWLTIERLAIAALSPRLGEDSLRAVLSYKETFFPAIALILLPRARSVWSSSPRGLQALDALAIGFCLLIAASALLSGADPIDRIVNGRRLIQLPLIYLCARLLPWRPEDARALIVTVIAAAAVVSVFGLMEVSFAESPIWRTAVPAAYYYHLSSESGLSATGTDFPIGGLPVIFYDFTTGAPHRRLVATFLEPTTVASFLALAAALAAAWRPVRPWTIAFVLLIGAGAALTLSKAGIAILAVSVGYVLIVSIIPRLRDPGWLISGAATLIGGLIVLAIALERSGAAQGPLAHFQGLLEGIQSAIRDPAGLGVGFGGNFGGSKLGAESTFGVTLVQVGWLGLVMWCAWMLGLIVATARLGARLDGLTVVALGLGAALCGYFGTAALTESAGGLLGNWLYAWIAGALVTAGAAASAIGWRPPVPAEPPGVAPGESEWAAR